MQTLTEELVQICDRLPERKVEELVDFARFLAQQGSLSGDAAWQRIIDDSTPRPKLDAFVSAALAEDPATPIDPTRL